MLFTALAINKWSVTSNEQDAPCMELDAKGTVIYSAQNTGYDSLSSLNATIGGEAEFRRLGELGTSNGVGMQMKARFEYGSQSHGAVGTVRSCNHFHWRKHVATRHAQFDFSCTKLSFGKSGRARLKLICLHRVVADISSGALTTA